MRLRWGALVLSLTLAAGVRASPVDVVPRPLVDGIRDRHSKVLVTQMERGLRLGKANGAVIIPGGAATPEGRLDWQEKGSVTEQHVESREDGGKDTRTRRVRFDSLESPMF